MTETFRQCLVDVVGQPVVSVSIDLQDFAVFKTLYLDRRATIDDAKLVEYYISYRWLDLKSDDTYIDIAAQDCPIAFFVQSHFGCEVFRQDLYYMTKGIHGTDIGGNASRIPLKTGSVSKMSLHNSLEHLRAGATSGSSERRNVCFDPVAGCSWYPCSYAMSTQR